MTNTVPLLEALIKSTPDKKMVTFTRFDEDKMDLYKVLNNLRNMLLSSGYSSMEFMYGVFRFKIEVVIPDEFATDIMPKLVISRKSLREYIVLTEYKDLKDFIDMLYTEVNPEVYW